MQIILISDRLARARSVHMSVRHLVGTGLFALVLLFGATAALYWLTLRYAADVKLPALQRLSPPRSRRRPSVSACSSSRT